MKKILPILIVLFLAGIVYAAPLTIYQPNMTITNATTTSATTTGSHVLSYISGSTQCLTVNTSGLISGTGAVCAAGGGITNLNSETLGSIGDVSTTSLAYGYHLTWDTSNWVSTTTDPFFDTEWDRQYNATSTFSGDLTISGYASSTSINTSGVIHIGGNSVVDGTGSFASANLTIDASGNLVTTGYASSTTGIWGQGDLHIGGNTTLDGTFGVTGVLTSTDIDNSGIATTTELCFADGTCQSTVYPLTDEVVLYLHQEADPIAGYDQLSTDITDEAETTASCAVATGYCALEEFIATSTFSNITEIPSGTWHFFNFASRSGGATSYIKMEVYARTTGGTETQLFSATSSVLTTDAPLLYVTDSVQPIHTINATDRIVVKYQQYNSGASRTVNLYYEGDAHTTHIHTPFHNQIDLGSYAQTNVEETITVPWIFSSDLRATSILHASTTDFDVLTVNGDGTFTGFASSTGGLFTQGSAHIGGALTIDTPLAADQGGTGLVTITDHGLVVGAGTSAMTELAVGGDGQLLIGSSAADPVFATLTCDSNLTCTTGAGTLEIDLNSDIEVTGYASSTTSLNTQGTFHAGGNGEIEGTFTLPALGTAAGTFIAVNASGDVIATTTPSAAVNEAENYTWTGTHDFDGGWLSATTSLDYWLNASTTNATADDITADIVTHAGDDNAHHELTSLTGQNYLTISTQTITVGEIEPDDLGASDFGGFDCDGTTCTIDDLFLKNTAADATAFGLTMGSGTTTDSLYVGGILDVTGTITGDVTGDLTGLASTATASADNPTDCAAGSYPLGVDANWDAESCTDATTEINTVVNGLGGTNLTCASETCNVDDAFITDGASDIMTGTLTADGITLGSTELLTIGSNTLTHDGTTFAFNDTIAVTGLASSTLGFTTNGLFTVDTTGRATTTAVFDITDGTNGMRFTAGATSTIEAY